MIFIHRHLQSLAESFHRTDKVDICFIAHLFEHCSAACGVDEEHMRWIHQQQQTRRTGGQCGWTGHSRQGDQVDRLKGGVHLLHSSVERAFTI